MLLILAGWLPGSIQFCLFGAGFYNWCYLSGIPGVSAFLSHFFVIACLLDWMMFKRLVCDLLSVTVCIACLSTACCHFIHPLWMIDATNGSPNISTWFGFWRQLLSRRIDKLKLEPPLVFFPLSIGYQPTVGLVGQVQGLGRFFIIQD